MISPQPIDIVETTAIKSLVEDGHIVIAAGGGGVPVIRKKNGELEGIPAVIDKDLAAERLAELLEGDYLIILTTVEKVAINYGKENQKDLDVITTEEARFYAMEGHFGTGSMLPKVNAAVKFVESNPGRKALITSLERIKEALTGKTGTFIVSASSRFWKNK